MSKKQCIAMLLAGGQGSRLYALTVKVAKPAVSYGGKYRIIDFPLSNCINSGIDTVGVLTQYQPLMLNEYIGNGEPWDLDRAHGGVHVLPPYQAKSGGDWYKGTANAIFQNLHFIDKYSPDHVLILSGDHIYKMDYSLMLAAHIQKNADCTIAVLDVSYEEAKRFGILDYDDDNKILSFEEKPAKPKSNHASMGIYIFKTSVLREYLAADDRDEKSNKDFGKNIIPSMLKDKCGIYAYQFSGYWKDVGTVLSLWEANMDLLENPPALDLSCDDFRIYSRNLPLPPQYIGGEAKVVGSTLTAGCKVYGTVISSVLGEGVTVEKGAIVEHSVIMNNCIVRSGAIVRNTVVDEKTEIGHDCKIGELDSEIALIGGGLSLADGTFVPPGKIIE